MKLLFTAIALSVSLSAAAQTAIEETCADVANVAGIAAQLKMKKAPASVSKDLMSKNLTGQEEKDLLAAIVDFTYRTDFDTVEGFMQKTYAACVRSQQAREKREPRTPMKLGSGA